MALALLVGAALATLWLPSPFPTSAAAAPAHGGPPADQLRLGYFGNVTHAPALVGGQRGFLARALEADGTGLSTQVFDAGPAAVEALNAGAIDAAYLGPNPAIGAYTSSSGRSLRVIAGATSGGAQLVVREDITSAGQLRGTVLTSPQLGGTQDVALRSWLADQGYEVETDGSGDVDINPTDNSQTLDLFRAGRIDGAWVPEPWASRLVLEAGAHVLVDERDLWSGSRTGTPGRFPTTVLVVDADFADRHPRTVKALVAGNADAVSWLHGAEDDERLEAINAGIEKAAGAPLPEEVLARALTTTEFTTDPIAGAFDRLLEQGVAAGVTRQGSLDGIFDTATAPPKGTTR